MELRVTLAKPGWVLRLSLLNLALLMPAPAPVGEPSVRGERDDRKRTAAATLLFS